MAKLMKGETWADAQKLVRGKPRFQYPVFVEVKADEIRCRVVYRPTGLDEAGNLCDVVQFLSYADKPLHNMGFLIEPLARWFKGDIYTELDIGIEVNGNFNDSYRWTQSSTGIPEEKVDKKTGKVSPALDVSMVKLLMFDLPESHLPYKARREVVACIAGELQEVGINAKIPQGELCHTAEQVVAVYLKYRVLNHEGAMVKTTDHLYERRRTYGWMKLKPQETFDGRITGVNRAHSIAGEPLNRIGSVTVVLEDGSTADPAGFPHGLGADIWANPEAYIGKWIEFQAMEVDRAGGYRHPFFKRFREDKA